MATVMVTGANRGIGFGLASRLLERGDTVVATYREADRSRELLSMADTAGGRLIPVVMEVRDESSIEECYRQVEGMVDHLDVLINNAGLGDGNVDMDDYDEFNTLGHLKADAILDMLAVNCVGPLMVAQTFLPLLERAEGPKLVMISSVMGSISGRRGPGEYGYCTSKTALNNMGHILASELEGSGIITVMLHPGWVRTTLGGPQAPLGVEESVSGLVRVIDGMTAEMNGGFFDWTGREVPW